MKTNQAKLCADVLLAALLFALASCSDVINKPEDPAAPNPAGKVLITVGSGAARTLRPDADLDALQYELSFAGPEGASLTEPFTLDAPTAVSLAEGAWRITAQAKDGSSVKAEGSWNGTVSPSATTPVNITLLPISGSPGILSYTIDHSQVSSAINGKTLTLYPVSESGTGTPVTPTLSDTIGTIPSLDPGFYRLQLVLTNDAQKTASRTEAVHIYAGLITPGTWVFLDADFVDAPAVPVITSLSPEDGKLTASWGSVSGVTAYEVYWHTADNTAAVPSANKLEVPSTDSLTTTITGLTNGTFYYVWVKAKNDSGVSGFSDSASGAPGFPLTDEVSPCQTITDSSSTIINPQGWTGAGTAIQRWTLNVVEKPTTYFAVIKTAAQTITVGGTNAGLVTQAPVGTTVDGSTASDTLSVFTVNSATYDLMFEGGSSDFTLTVSEPGKTSKNITVTLNVIPNLSGVAVFKVTRLAGDTAGITETLTALQAEAWATQGTLTRITGIQEIEIFYSTSFYKSQWLPSSGNRLLDAMAWVNENAQDNEEYLIRLEKNEQIPKVALTFQGRSNITMRLRGIGGERTITHDGTFPTNNGYFYADSQLDRNSRAVNGGTHLISGTYTTGPLIWNSTNITLSLEQHVTLTGLTSQINFAGYFNPNRGYCLVMLDGSKITGYTAYSNFTPIDLSTGSTASNSARFYMFGGAISGNICSANGVMNTRNPTTYTGIGAFFVKKGGSISGNVLRTDETMPANFIYFFNAANKRTIIDGHEYVVPPLFNEGD